MRVISVTGANSFIGKHLIKSLSLRSDAMIIGLTSNASNAMISCGSNTSIFEGDLLRRDSLDGFAQSGGTVVNLAYLRNGGRDGNLTAMNNLLDLCETAKISRFIHCSTAVVVGRTKVCNVTETTPCEPVDEYQETKLLIEKLVVQRSFGKFDYVIVRPTAVFGEGGKNLIKIIDDLKYGNPFINYIKACFYSERKMNLVCVENVVASLEYLMDDVSRKDETFIISDDDDNLNNFSEILKILLKRLGHRCLAIPIIPLPSCFLSLVLRLAGRTNINPLLKYDCGNLLNCGFKKRTTFGEGLVKFIDLHLNSQPSGKPVDR